MKRNFAKTGLSWIGILGLFIINLAGCVAPSHKFGRLENIAVKEKGAEIGGDFCKDFYMSPPQVSAFFGRAQIYAMPALHSGFDILPCYVRGTATQSGSPVTWEIRAGGTGVIISSDQAVLFGCSSCDDLFGQEK